MSTSWSNGLDKPPRLRLRILCVVVGQGTIGGALVSQAVLDDGGGDFGFPVDWRFGLNLVMIW